MTRSSDDDISIVDTLLIPDHRIKFLKLLGARFMRWGIGSQGIDIDESPEDGDAALRTVLCTVAERIKAGLDGGEVMVAFFGSRDAGTYVAGCSGGCSLEAWDRRLPAIREAIGSEIPPPFESCVGIQDPEGDDTGVKSGGGSVLAAPMVIGDLLMGIVAIAQDGDADLSGRDGARLELAAVMLAGTAQQVTSDALNEKRFHSLANALSTALDARDPKTRGHSSRVAMYSMAILNELGYAECDKSQRELRNRIRAAGILHDIGKVGIPDSILLKDDSLTDEEYERIKQHPVMGTEILTACYGLKDLVPGVLHHHEHYDGSGYPFGLTGDDIPFMARVIALADAFDAITSDRPFRKASTHEEAIEILKGNVSANFDPLLLDALLRAHAKGTLKYVRLPSETMKPDAPSYDEVERDFGADFETVPSLPDVLTTVNSLLDDPSASLKRIAEVLSTDSGLASRVLRLVNSAYYGLPRMVSTIALATTILGAKAIKSHVVNIAYADLMSDLGGCHEEYNLLWSHALKTATWARTIASDLDGVDPEEAFTAGLIHDIGKAICLKLRGDAYARIILEAYKSGKPLMGVEEEMVGFDHTLMGAWAASRWKLPEPLVNSIRWHHNPSVVQEKSEEIYRLVVAVHIADIAARAVDATTLGFTAFLLVELCPRVLRTFGSEYVTDLEAMKDKVEEAEQQLESTFAETCVG
jgi:putative nucleotidyltransferase with HDIG domain